MNGAGTSSWGSLWGPRCQARSLPGPALPPTKDAPPSLGDRERRSSVLPWRKGEQGAVRPHPPAALTAHGWEDRWEGRRMAGLQRS